MTTRGSEEEHTVAPEAPAATSTTEPAGQNGGTAPAGTAPAGDGGSNGSAGKSFTQDDVDRIVKDRVAREQSKFAGFDDLKTKAAEYDRLQEEQKSEIEKATGRAAKEASDKASAEADARWASRIIRTEVKAAAAGKLADPEDATRFIDLAQFKLGNDGEVDTKAIAKAVDELVKEKPYLAVNGTRTGRQNHDAGARTPASGGEDMNSLIRRAAGRT
jgi:hypothetical protein